VVKIGGGRRQLEQSKDVLTKSQREVWGTLKDPCWGKIRNNGDLVVHIAQSEKQNRVTDRLGDYMFSLATKLFETRTLTQGYIHIKDDVIADAVRQMISSYSRFDVTRCNNACSYLTIVTLGAFAQSVSRENKQQAIKKCLAELI